MALEKKDLLKDRIKVTTPFLGMQSEGYEVNMIFTPSSIYEAKYPKLYPANFKRLSWWEERKIEDMPEYVKNDKKVFKVSEWTRYETQYSGKVILSEVSWVYIGTVTYKLQPANESDYQQYINSLTPSALK